MNKVVGVDLSTTSTGVASIIQSRDAGIRQVDLSRIRSEPEKTRGQIGAATRVQRRSRMRRTADRIHAAAIGTGPPSDLVVIESPSFGSSGESGTWDRAGLWWMVVDGLHSAGITVMELGPQKVRKYATGSAATSGPNKVTKDMVLAAVVRRYPYADVDGNDVSDALVLAAMGARLMGHPIEASLPAANLAALKDVRPPQETRTP